GRPRPQRRWRSLPGNTRADSRAPSTPRSSPGEYAAERRLHGYGVRARERQAQGPTRWRPGSRGNALERRVGDDHHPRTLVAPRAVGRLGGPGPTAQVDVVPLPALGQGGLDLRPRARAKVRAGLDSQGAGG